MGGPDERLRSRAEGEGGNTSILVGITIVILIGFAALVVDIGSLYRVRNELQNASDSASLAGAQELDSSAEGIARARQRAIEYGQMHIANETTVVLASGDIVFGHWDALTGEFTALGPEPADPRAVNGLQVTSRRSGAQGDAVPMSLAPVIGIETSDVSAEAIAVGGGPCGECTFPLVVADCALEDALSADVCEYCLQFQDNGSDNAGWTSFDKQSVSPPVIRNLIREACYDRGQVAIDAETNECGGLCNRTAAGQEVRVNNGNMMNEGGSNFCPVLRDVLLRGDPNATPQSFIVRVPVLDSVTESCDASQFSSYHPIEGYATLEIYGVKCGSTDPGVMAPSSPCAPPPSQKYIVAALRCDADSYTPGGCEYFGIESRRMRLVQ